MNLKKSLAPLRRSRRSILLSPFRAAASRGEPKMSSSLFGSTPDLRSAFAIVVLPRHAATVRRSRGRSTAGS